MILAFIEKGIVVYEKTGSNYIELYNNLLEDDLLETDAYDKAVDFLKNFNDDFDREVYCKVAVEKFNDCDFIDINDNYADINYAMDRLDVYENKSVYVYYLKNEEDEYDFLDYLLSSYDESIAENILKNATFPFYLRVDKYNEIITLVQDDFCLSRDKFDDFLFNDSMETYDFIYTFDGRRVQELVVNETVYPGEDNKSRFRVYLDGEFVGLARSKKEVDISINMCRMISKSRNSNTYIHTRREGFTVIHAK